MNPFLPEAISEETHRFNAQLEALLATAPATYEVPPEETRLAREEGRGVFGPLQIDPQAEWRSIPGPGGELPIRVMLPAGEVRGVYLHFHGGGWVLGRPHHADVRSRAIAESAGVAVVSVDYRLAPEHPYPAGPDDCEASALWLAKEARREFGTSHLLIGGESAGAHLVAVTLQRMRDRHGYTDWVAANLPFGVFDLTPPPSVRQWGTRNLVLSTPTMEWFYNHFIGDRNRQDPDISPLYGRLNGMPPALFSVGTMDPLIDDSLFMHARWVAAGNEAELAVYPGAVHGFINYAYDLARQANDRIQGFLAEKLDAAVAAAAA